MMDDGERRRRIERLGVNTDRAGRTSANEHVDNLKLLRTSVDRSRRPIEHRTRSFHSLYCIVDHMTSGNNITNTDGSPLAKKAKLSEKANEELSGFGACKALLRTTVESPVPTLPSSLTTPNTKNSLEKLQLLFHKHGFRTSVVMSPRPALSIYKDSCILLSPSEAKEVLLMMLGMHPNQDDMERWYAVSVKKVYCLSLFCIMLRKLCPEAAQNFAVDALLLENEALCRSMGAAETTTDELNRISTTVSERVASLIQAAVKADTRIRSAQLEHEFNRLTYRNSTISNAIAQLFLTAHGCSIKDIYFKRSHMPKYERITVYLYDPNIDEFKPPPFTFLPSLHCLLEQGPEALVQGMVKSFWSHLLRHGYFATPAICSEFTPDLEKYFLSGIAQNPNIPLLLNAHFTPSYALSFYLQGKPGAGKSSLVRNFCPALNATVEEHADPEILVRFVKQNLNKPFEDLQLELELRPNNNDLSVMSIIQGRRMTMTQSKPGLVVVDLEEMASNDPDANPNQLKTAQLISQRFSGRNGDYKADAKAPRNSEKRGISGDATLITLFTSNYELEKECKDALLRLKMFENLKCMVVSAVSGDDRSDFAHAYIQQCVQDRFANLTPECSIELNISMGEGDTRLLVRHLRLLAFYLCSLVADSVSVKSRIVAKIAQTSSGTYIVSSGDRSIELKTSSLQNLLPVEYRAFDSRTEIVVDGLRESFKGDESNILNRLDEISQILDFYFAKALAPVVVVSNNAELIEKLVALVGVQKDVQMIPNVDPKSYKMMKSLYDPSDTPNLRDDILKFGRGAFVAVELECHSKDAQLCIREIIEDSPSMTAFSTSKSALYKHGLFFGVYVDGEITPEVLSRASLII